MDSPFPDLPAKEFSAAALSRHPRRVNGPSRNHRSPNDNGVEATKSQLLDARKLLETLASGCLCTVLAITTGLVCSCAPKVNRFEVVPSHACAGTPVTLQMEVVGTPTVVTNPQLEREARDTYAPPETTHFVLSVRRWPTTKTVGSEAEVKVMPGTPPEPDEITATVACHEAVITGALERPVSEWDPRLVLTTVTSNEDRGVHVEHAGRSARLSPENPTTNAFEGASPAGYWRLSASLMQGETCESIASSMTLLNLSAEVRCKD